jgi:hypothetical protein
MSTQPPILTELKLTPEMKEAVNTAAAARRPISVAYVNPTGEPEISFRGSTQAYSDTQLAIWVRNPESGLLKATRNNPVVALIYGNLDPDNRGFMVFRGRGRVDDSDAVRRKVYEQSPEIEQSLDKERKGVPLIIDLESVNGFFGGAVLKMRS